MDHVSEDEENNFDKIDELSVSIPSADSGGGDEEQEEDGQEVSKATTGKRGRKRLKAGSAIQLSPAKGKVQRGKRADCWKYFKEIIVPSTKEIGVTEHKANCKFCGKSYLYHPGGPTTMLNRHLLKCTQYQNKLAKATRQLAQGTLNFVDDGSIIVNPTEYDHDHTRLLIAKMIIVHEYSFRMVEHKWFNALMKWMNSNYESIGRKTIKNECMKVYESEKDLLKKSLREAESISLTTDLWTSNQNIQYMCLVAHYIDVDWVLQCRVLNFFELDPPYTGVVIAQAVFECLVDWKIEDKVMTITLDNAANNNTAVSNLKAKLLARKNTQFDPAYFHVRCAAHIVNLVVNDGLQQINSLISDLRNTVKYFKKSPAHMYKFIEICNQYAITVGKGLCLDVVTRWSSTYRMLDSCIAYKDAFDYYSEIDNKYEWKPTSSQWKLYEKFKPILGTMAGATTAFLASTYPTANVFYPYIVTVKIALKEAGRSSDAYFASMSAAMLDKFDKYWEERNNVMVIATILDPRFKMRYIRYSFQKIYEPLRYQREINDIEKELEELYKKHETICRCNVGANSLSNVQLDSSSKDRSSSLASIVPTGFQSFLESTATESSKSELLLYLDEANVSIEDDNFNLVNYWKVNSHRFPVVASMAKRFLAVPASSVSSESTFSTSGRILDDYRSSLKPATVQALVCASSWIRGSGRSPIRNGGDDDGDIEFVDFPNCMVASN